MTRWRDASVWITGATRGIGRALADELAARGARLALCGRDPVGLRAAEVAARAAGSPAVFTAAFDLLEADAIDRFAAAARDAIGSADVLVNNAGCNPRKAHLADVTTDEFDAILGVNLRAPFLLARAALASMIPRGHGHIVQVLSTVCHAAIETMGAYSAAKTGLRALTDVLRKEVRPHGVRVTSVFPGGTNTGFRAHPRADYMDPADVARAIVALLELPPGVVPHEFTFRPMVESNF